jgi:peptidoglycan/LPS O-acetylase OafA/YrhL
MKNFQSIEALRGWMAWWVVVGHALGLIGVGGDRPPPFLDWVPDKAMSLLLRGDSAVHVFIIISGFVIAHLLLRKPEPYGPYIGRRFMRLFPVYAVCLVIAMLVADLYRIAYIDSGFFSSGLRVEREIEVEKNFLSHFLLHITLLHSVVPEVILPYSSTAILAPAWSLSLEWQFYLIAPLLVMLIGRRSVNTMIATTAVLVAIRVALQQQSVFEWQYGGFFFVASSYFLIGIMCRLALDRIEHKKSCVELLLLAVLLSLTVDKLAVAVWLVWFAIVLYEAGFLKLGSAYLRAIVGAVALNRAVGLLGRWSYSTYLIHIPVFSVLIGSYGLAVGPDDMRPDVAAAILLASFPLIACLSVLLYKYVEMPGIALGRRMFAAAPSGPVLEAGRP